MNKVDLIYKIAITSLMFLCAMTDDNFTTFVCMATFGSILVCNSGKIFSK